jgi:hypothetical protein
VIIVFICSTRFKANPDLNRDVSTSSTT